jgi:hypothetical protein
MNGFRVLDAILRNETDGCADGSLPLAPLVKANILLAMGYGVCMGLYGLFRPVEPEYRQIIASMLKVPALFGLTLLVTFPSLYVFNTLLGSRLRFGELVRLVIAGLSVLVAVLAAFGPIVALFSASTTSYPFILLLNVAVFALSGAFGLSALHRSLTKLPTARPVAHVPATPVEPPPDNPTAPVDIPTVPRREAVDNSPKQKNAVFYAWMVVFGLVGGQMGWVLRPFIGAPNMPFTWFRPRESSFIEGVAQSVRALLGW